MSSPDLDPFKIEILPTELMLRQSYITRKEKLMKRFTPFYLVLVFLLGCLGSQQTTTQPVGETSAPQALVEIHLSTPKTSYAAKEAIPLEISIQNGKFDLFVPFVTVATKSAFTAITVTNANGEVVKRKRPITMENPQKYVIHQGKSVRCIQGFELKAGAQQTVSLENLRQYYRLPAGTYTIAVEVELEVYRESLLEPHPQIVELEQDIARLQSNVDAALTPAVKRDAINEIREQIEFIKSKHKDEKRALYLPVKSRRGKASLMSNSITLTLEETEAAYRQILLHIGG